MKKDLFSSDSIWIQKFLSKLRDPFLLIPLLLFFFLNPITRELAFLSSSSINNKLVVNRINFLQFESNFEIENLSNIKKKKDENEKIKVKDENSKESKIEFSKAISKGDLETIREMLKNGYSIKVFKKKKTKTGDQSSFF